MGVSTTNSFLQPIDFSGISDHAKARYEKFLDYTNNVGRFAEWKGDLTELAELAHTCRDVIDLASNSIRGDQGIRDQWALNRLSDVKGRLANAIDMKRSYYENDFFGIITKYVLMIFRQWNDGDTPAIVAAEDFLLFWDSCKSIRKISCPDHPRYGKYIERIDFRTDHLDRSRYFNYNPKRQIEMASSERINYASLRV